MTLNSIGQTIVPAQDPDIILYPAPTWDIENTGCDIREGFAIGQKRGVMVYDGSDPYIQWFDGNGNPTGIALLSGILDPDVVMTSDGSQAFIVYELNGDIFLDFYLWNGSYQLNGQMNLGLGNNPNIDISLHNYIAITWVDDLGNIKSVVGDFSSGSLNLSATSDITNNEEDRTPDVAIFELQGNIKVKYTYVSFDKKAKKEVLKVKQADYLDVFNNSVTSNPTLLRTIYLSYESFGRPRIATPPFIDASPHNINDYMIVIDYKFFDGQSPDWKILGYNTYNNNLTTNILLNPNIVSINNSKPVVTYAGDFIVISWTSDIYQNGALANEVVSRKLYNYGSLMNNTISIVNNFIQEYQYTSSIAGRFTEGEFNLHHYVNEGWGNMEYKVTNAASTVLRKNTHTTSPSISFNISSDGILELSTKIQNYRLSIYNILGQLLISKKALNNSSQLNINGLPTGNYIIRVESTEIAETFKFIKN